MPNEIKTKKGIFLFVEVPDDVTWWEILDNNLFKWLLDIDCNQFLQYGKKKENIHSIYYNVDNFYLPSGKWISIGLLKNITEEQAESVIEFKTETIYVEDFESHITSGYRNYNISYTGIFNFRKAKESLQSLIIVNKLDLDKNYLILKKI